MTELRKIRTLPLLVIFAGLTLAVLWRFIPAPPGAEGALYYSPMGAPTTLLDLTLATGSGLLFWRALRNFKKELKPAYLLVACAQLAVGLLTLFFPYTEYYGLWDNVWLNMSTYLAYLVGAPLMYFGSRQFIQRLGLRTRSTSLLIMLLATTIAWCIHAVMPHNLIWGQFSEREYDLFELVVIIPVLWYAAAAYNILKIRRSVGRDYQGAFTWLGIGLLLQMANAVTILVLDTRGYDNWYFSSRAYAIPALISDIALLFAAYKFNSIGLVQVQRPAKMKASSIDIVLYAANMVSNPAPIDPALDELRLITSRTTTTGGPVPLTDADQQRLCQVYLHIEEYLTSSEPLRSFTKADIRTAISRHFGLNQDGTDTFWPQLPA